MATISKPAITFLSFFVVVGSGHARAATPECAREGQRLYPATDDLSLKELERTTERLMGPALARIVRDVPWRAVWRGDSSFSQSAYFIQGFGETFSLPDLKFTIAAPPPLAIEVDLQVKTDRVPCVPIDVPGYPNWEMGPTEGAVAIRAPMKVTVTMSAGGISDRWELPSEEAVVGWQREDGRLRVWLDALG